MLHILSCIPLSLPSDHAPTAAFLVHTEKMVHHNYYLPRMRLFSVCKVSRSRTHRCVCSACRTGIILLIIQEPLVAGPVLRLSTIHSSQQLHCLPWNVHSQKDIFEIVSRQKAARRYSESELLFLFSLALALNCLQNDN